MGERGEVKIIEDDEHCFYLYAHWGASSLVNTVRDAMMTKEGRNRLDDPEYLARIIFEHMIGDERGTETGFGITALEHDDAKLAIILDFEKKSVTIHDKFLNRRKTYKFDTFIGSQYEKRKKMV